MAQVLGDIVTGNVKAQTDAQLAAHKMNLDHDLQVRREYRWLAYILVAAFIALAGYILVINKDQSTALTVIGYVATLAVGWISGHEHGRRKS